MPVTIKDIAKRAGVSRGTVDRVIHKRGNVASYLEQRIENVIKELGYKRNIIASQLALNKSIHIGLLLPHPAEDIFWQQPQLGIEQAVEDYRYLGIQTTEFYFNLAQNSSFKHAMNQIDVSSFDAFIVAPMFKAESTAFLEQLDKSNIPVICINTEIKTNFPYYYIGQASYQSGKLAGKLFDISLQKASKIGVVQIGPSPFQAEHYLQKLQGLNDYIQENTLPISIHAIQLENYSNVAYLQYDLNVFIEQHGPFDGYFIPNSRSYQFISLIQSANPVIVGFDLITENITALQNGQIDFLINQNPKQQGFLAVKSIVNHLIFGQMINDRQYVSLDIVVKENA